MRIKTDESSDSRAAVSSGCGCGTLTDALYSCPIGRLAAGRPLFNCFYDCLEAWGFVHPARSTASCG